ncbi:MAG: hypothetical protein U0904_10930, partial [Candidatus Nanopelagicales bacterium]|nr:hypothetical protein [Candidatus Nanopelagicales bacterium]
MTLAGDDRAYTFYLKMVHEAIEMLGESLPDALLRAPEEYRSRISAEIADRIDRQKLEVRFFRAGTVLQQGGPRPWFGSWNTADGYLWRRLRSYLLVQKGWSAKDVDLLDDSSDRVMQYLEDPRPDSQFVQNEFRTQGLVLGYVQSGKTANFTALIAKSVDAGYKLVIVLSGIHNSLRAQTQRRLDLELGLVDDPKGVGTPSDTDQVWWPITTSDLSGDFNPGTVRAAPIQQGMRSIMVVKKNATVLRRLVRWLDGIVPADLPVLVIDDEADQASINTKATLEDVDLTPNDQGEYPEDKELDPSIINGLIRDLLSRFSKVAFVAYTATPFANVLIDPDA